MSDFSPGEITLLLSDLGRSPNAADKLVARIYDELRWIAGSLLRRDWPGQSLQATELVHEACIRLKMFDRGAFRERPWQNRAHFFSAVAKTMGRILLDRSRARRAAKRGGILPRLSIEDLDVPGPQPLDPLAVKQALARLQVFDPRIAQVVELHFFQGLSDKETAKILKMGAATVRREWTLAKAWLRKQIEDSAPMTPERWQQIKRIIARR